MTCTMELELGAFVLLALEPQEANAVQLHLGGCEACRDEADSLAFTASLLALLSPQDIDLLEELEHTDSQPTAGGYDETPVGAAAAPDPARRHHGRTYRQRRLRRVGVVLAAAAFAVSATFGVAQLAHPGDGSPSSRVVQAVDPNTHVRAAVTLSSRSWGTELHLTLAGAYPRGWCALVAHGGDGTKETAARWVADGRGAADVSGAIGIPATQLSELDVVTDTGRVLVRIAVPPHGT